MCGIAGLITTRALDERLVRRMTDTIAHRGPDDEGVWIDSEAGVGLGHRRLSIIDLSPSGHQPMESHDGRWVLNFNGEIYNHKEVRSELDAAGLKYNWRGHSDTETLVEAIGRWGLRPAIAKCAGMFAFAAWDRSERILYLVRDRFGEKPLYYGWTGGDFVFASELKAIRAHPRFDNAIDRRALALFASRNYVPAPHSIFQRLFKLEPGCILAVTPGAARTALSEAPREGTASPGLRCERYWSYRAVVLDGLKQPIGNFGAAIEELEQQLGHAVEAQSMADVPVGAFLSGGIDSSTIVALYQKHSNNPVRTFSIGFEEAGFDESQHAKAVAAHLGTVHHEHYVSVAEARDVIPKLPAIYDEPFADSSQIPTWLVSRFARGEVKVALTGDGGDELFAGYNRHFHAPRLWRRLSRIPRPLRALGAPLGRLPSSLLQGAAGLLRGFGQPHSGAKLQKALRVGARAGSFDDVYRSFIDEWAFERSPVRGAGGSANGLDLDLDGAPDAVRMMYRDAVTYLPDDILCKVDRASMSVSLETRVPFLDHRVAALAARIPLAFKVADGSGKHIVRQLLSRHVPPALIDRPKAGFAVPVGEWIKGPLRPWAEDLLDPARMDVEGWFDPGIVRRRWAEHLSGRRDSTPALWSILMFQAWLRT